MPARGPQLALDFVTACTDLTRPDPVRLRIGGLPASATEPRHVLEYEEACSRVPVDSGYRHTPIHYPQSATADSRSLGRCGNSPPIHTRRALRYRRSATARPTGPGLRWRGPAGVRAL